MASAVEIAEVLSDLESHGHPMAPCTHCGFAILIAKGTTPKCKMTPGCPGKHIPPSKRGS